MAKKRGRPTKAVQSQLLQQGALEIAAEFRRLPLREPVDAKFAAYYRRVLAGDPMALFEYQNEQLISKELEGSFYELLGRLVAMKSVPAAKHIVSEVVRLGC